MLRPATARAASQITRHVCELLWLGAAVGCGTTAIESLGIYANDAGPRRPSRDVEDAGPDTARASSGAAQSDASQPEVAGSAAAAGSGVTSPAKNPTAAAGALPRFERDDTAQAGLSEELRDMLARESDLCELGIAYPRRTCITSSSRRSASCAWTTPCARRIRKSSATTTIRACYP